MELAQKAQTLKGGQFLIAESQAEQVFIPEELTEEQRMFAQMTHDFLEQNISQISTVLINKKPVLPFRCSTKPPSWACWAFPFRPNMAAGV